MVWNNASEDWADDVEDFLSVKIGGVENRIPVRGELV